MPKCKAQDSNAVCAAVYEDFGVEIRPLNIAEVKLVIPQIHRDARGFFSETYSRQRMDQAGIATEFVQDNHSLSVEVGTLRGLHFQVPPRAQGKLLRVTRGSVFDVAVDIRVGSPTYGQHVSAVLSAENWMQIWIPAGFAHGYCTLEPNTEVIYKVTDYYAPECDRGLKWDDAALGIRWPVGPDSARLSDKDRRQPSLKEMAPAFVF
jgi:dTDP-4-dehydrorhamnose 3,5-epimerase